MNIPSKFDILHDFYGKAKYAFLIIFSFTVVFLSLISHTAYGESVVGTVQTKLSVKIDGKTQVVTTTQNNIDAALKQNNIILAKNDITEPPLSTYLSGETVDVNVIRAIPVLITDGSQSWAGKSAYTQPYDILKQLNVTVYPEDKVSVGLIMDPAATGLVGQNVIIDRAPVYTIYVDGGTKVVRSWTTNVSDLLAEKGISLGVNDIVDPPKTSTLSGITEITVTRINYADIDENVTVPFDTIYKIDTSLGLTDTRIGQEGVNEQLKKTYHLVYENGVEVSKTLTNSVTVTSLVDRIIYRGAIVGIASEVSDGTYGQAMVTAFKDAPRGTKLFVTNLNNGKQIEVTVVDSGPYVSGRILDLSPDAFQALGGTSGLLQNIAAQIVE
jgi:uncharacterized protein YabE (DUF348 family)